MPARVASRRALSFAACSAIYRRGRHEKNERTKRRPVVKIPDRLLAHMRRWHAQDEKRGLSTVIHFGGEQMERIHTAFESCAADAGLTGPTPHWLRHTCCTWLMERGTDLWEAAGYAGMSAMTLSKHYVPTTNLPPERT